jgi:pilus assembly protein CpaE
MMSVQGEADYLRRSMLAGAREFLIKPFSGEELVTGIHRVYQFAAARRAAAPPPTIITPAAAPPAPPPRGAKVIAVLGSKGGSGASTIAVNLAVALRDETKARVALVDANLEFGDVGVLLNLPNNRTIADLVSGKAEIDEEVLDGTMASHSSAIKVLLAPSRPELAELVTPDHLKKIMELLDKSYDFIVVDLWKSFQETTIFFLDHADLILLASTADLPAIKNAKLFFELTEQLGYPPAKTLFVLNKDDGRTGVSAKDIEGSIKHPVGMILPKDETNYYDVIIACSDGLATYQSSPKVEQKTYSTSEILGHMTGYKDTVGEFVTRRMWAFKNLCLKEGIIHKDDISCSAIHLG